MNFNLSVGKAHDSNQGHGYGRLGTGHPVTGRTRGSTFPGYQYTEKEEIENVLDDDLDDFVNVVNAIRAKTTSGVTTVKDFGGRVDRGDFTGSSVGGLSELSDHTTTITKGISPRISYRSKTNMKGPAAGAPGNAMYIKSAPGRISGTQYGTSRAPLPWPDEDDDSIFSLTDLKDPMEQSFMKHQKRVNRIKNMIISLEES